MPFVGLRGIPMHTRRHVDSQWYFRGLLLVAVHDHSSNFRRVGLIEGCLESEEAPIALALQ